MAYARRSTSETAVVTTLNTGVNASVESIVLAASTGWPTGGSGNFYMRIESETIDCASRSGTTVTVQSGGRGALGTTAATHTAGVAVTLVFTSGDADEANYTVSKTVGKATAAGQILVVDAANSFVALQTKTSGQILVGSGTTLASVPMSGDATLASTGALTVASNAITKAKIVSTGRYKEKEFSKSGALTTGTGTFRWYPTANTTIVDAWASVGTSNTGATLICDVNISGTTIFSTQTRRPTIAISGHYAASGSPDGTVTMTGGTDYLTVDIDQVGSTIAGSDLVVGVRYYET